MFYYYGRKKKLCPLYPAPRCPVIVEPFAGSAAYSLHGDNWRREVILVERDPEVAAIWRWLIEEAIPEDILSLPDVQVGDSVTSRLVILHAASKRAFTYRRYTATPILVHNWALNKPRMAQELYKVKHWRIIEGDYHAAPDIEATWFIDPPYQGQGGEGYRFSSKALDYAELARWTLSRKGQVIACEGKGASYLPFQPLTSQNGVGGKRNQEVVYLRDA